ncbi:baeRF7 domain-containing protein [Algoriphagus sp.]|uniref:baeRF7 domain-containing protein n=1 Tax=Algoriphagus sp. TaxID=1872435 RepID=UPI003F7110CD
MKIFDLKKFVELSKKSSKLYVSIFLPASRQSTDGYKQDKIHLKNQLSKVEKDLENEYQQKPEEIKELLEPASNLLKDPEFWKHNSDMITIYLSDGEMELIQVPQPIEDSSYFISTKPFLLPLIPEISGNGHYYLLVLNLERIHLYEATRNVIQEIILDPDKVAVSHVAEEEDFENQQFIQGQGGVGAAGAMFHGHGEGSDEEKKKTILNYFHRMTNMLEPILNKNPLPLYLAGVDYLIPLYREANKYNHLMEGHIPGSFTANDLDLLHQESWELAAPNFANKGNNLLDSFEGKKAEELALDNETEELLKAAFTGGVDTLFVSNNHKHLWGKYNEDTHNVEFHEKQTNGVHCLIDEASACVIRSKGNVFLLDPEDIPGDSPLAGILRYPIPTKS